MSEENTNIDNVEVNPVEQEAMASGWVPKDQFKGEEHKWVDAGEFLRRGELFKKIDDQNRHIDSQSKQLKELRSALNELKTHHSKVREVEYERALSALKAEKKQALLDGDADALISVDERIDLVKQAVSSMKKESEAPAVQEQPEVHPEFQNWVNQNAWYQQSKPMAAFADALGTELKAQGLGNSEILKRISEEVRKEFPHKFSNPNREKPGAVESVGNRGGEPSGKFALSDDERRIMQRFVRQGVMTEKEYIAELKKVRG